MFDRGLPPRAGRWRHGSVRSLSAGAGRAQQVPDRGQVGRHLAVDLPEKFRLQSFAERVEGYPRRAHVAGIPGLDGTGEGFGDARVEILPCGTDPKERLEEPDVGGFGHGVSLSAFGVPPVYRCPR